MLRIRDAQMTFFGEQQKALFLERVREFAAASLKIQVAHTTLQALFERGTEYGLVSEREYVGYFSIALTVGVSPPAPDPEWVIRCLSDKARPASERVRELFALAKSHEHDRA